MDPSMSLFLFIQRSLLSHHCTAISFSHLFSLFGPWSLTDPELRHSGNQWLWISCPYIYKTASGSVTIFCVEFYHMSLFYLSIIFSIFATQSILHNLTTHIFLTVFTEYIPELPRIPPLLPQETLQRNLHTVKYLPAYQIIPAYPTKPNTLR